jgi:potassium-dependent mechanosensitive channel
MRQRARAIIARLCLLLALCASGLPQAAAQSAEELPVYEESISTLRALLKANAGRHDGLQSLAEDSTRLTGRLQKCVRDLEQRVLALETELDGLGEPVPGESGLVSEQRAALRQQQAQAKSELAACRVLLEEASAIGQEIQARRREFLRQKLFVPGTDLLRVAAANLQDPSPWLDYAAGLLDQYRGLLALGGRSLLALAGVMLLAMLPGWLLRSWLLRRADHRTDNDFTSILLQSLTVALASYLPWLLATAAGSVFFLLVPEKPDDFRFWAYVTYSLTAFLAFMLGVRVLLHPLRQLPSPLLLPQELAQAMARRLRVLGLLCLVGVIYYASLQVLHLPVAERQLARGLLLTLFVLNLLWFVWLLGRLPDMQKTSRRVRGLLALLLVASLATEWLGYRGLSTYLLRGIVGTALLTALAWILHRMLSELALGLDRGKFGWQRWLRAAVGLADGQKFPGLSTLRILLVLGLWTGYALLLMKLWGVPDSLFQQLYLAFHGGFRVGGLYITPSRIIIALLIFALLLQVFSRLKEMLEKRWLPSSKLDRGAREATATVFGYTGFLVAVLVGLSAAGLDLTKLAIIAGALSVGIGFGLQNIVNNFVSGLILLFERPIATGDFVSVGDTEGYVRRISIRSTEIETLDRRSVIVPNSDLISERVINWMRNDSYGRVKVEVGVAYGSDLRLVSRLLREIACAHPDVLNNSQTQPSVFCTGFGDSAIQFTIYAVVGNFTQRLQVANDMYLAIEAAFARHGIEIPYPQRVLHQAADARKAGTRAAATTAAPPPPPQSDPVHLPNPE